jgi:DNA-binding MarR family transcriptional regulator
MDENRIEHALFEAIGRLMRSLRRRPAFAQGGSLRFYRLLSLINAREGITPGELAELMDMRPSSLTEMLGRLELDGIIKRLRDENDLRVVHVVITEDGRSQLNNIKENLPEYEVLKGILTPEEAEEFIRLSTKLGDGIERRSAEIFGDELLRERGHGPTGPRGHHGRFGGPNRRSPGSEPEEE